MWRIANRAGLVIAALIVWLRADRRSARADYAATSLRPLRPSRRLPSPASAGPCQDHHWIGREVEDTAIGGRGIPWAIAPDGDETRPVAWPRPKGGGRERTTDPAALTHPVPLTPDTRPRRRAAQRLDEGTAANR
ncbi:hypothetical protein ACFV83_24610 [Streptomyces pharetrae]|uniref:hypothetical protein n=1 Tax=Streptomyces pharetrae TaxID=291370 RepID=UPI00364CA0BA